MGGESKNKHTSKKEKNERGGTIHTQQPVLGMKERNGNVIAIVVPNRNKETILPLVRNVVEQDSTIITDEYTAYKDLKFDFEHLTVNHGAKEYVNHMAHTNGIENFWSHLKRGIDGIYHWVSKDHLQSYVDEFTLRFNTRSLNTQSRFDLILTAIPNKRLTYQNLIK
jgi:transposase-like protein